MSTRNGRQAGPSLKLLNLCVWNKDNGGRGSFYEAIPLRAGGGLNVAADLGLVVLNALASSTTFTLAAFSAGGSNRSLLSYLAVLSEEVVHPG